MWFDLKKMITVIGIILGVILAIIAVVFLVSDSENKQEESGNIIEADVIMPTKVSRPGCEESDSCYIPSLITIEQGDQVIWSNEDVAFHSVTSGVYGNPNSLFDSGHLDPQQKFWFTFEEEGTFDYFCTLHPWMAGKVIVQ